MITVIRAIICSDCCVLVIHKPPDSTFQKSKDSSSDIATCVLSHGTKLVQGLFYWSINLDIFS